jgi:hypothetical protein
MSNNYKDPAFKKWLDQLQQESWQLELIISGFAIYGLLMAYEPLMLSAKVAQNEQHLYQLIISVIGLIACSILIFNLLLHVILRGLWIGALGLRYVSGDIDYESLNYSPKFTKFLKKKIGSFDRYISILEDYCSILFAVSFLLIFYVLGIVVSFITIVAIAVYLIDNDADNGFLKTIGIILVLTVLFGMILTLIDFIGQGILKKNKWVAKFYFPIYRLFGFLTLSFFYRPLVYNFLDNKFGKRVTFMLIPIYALIIFIASIDYQNSNYLEQDRSSSSNYANSRNYGDMLLDKDNFVRIASIPSKVIHNSYLNVFIDYTENIEGQIFSYNKNLKPEDDRRGLNINNMFTSNPFENSKKRDSLTLEYLKSFNEMILIKIDSIDYDTDFLIATNSKKQLGFETFVNIKDLPEGKHLLKVNRRRIRDKDTITVRDVSIPFWYFKE